MKNKWFYPGLFWESLRQLRVIGITALVIFEVVAMCLIGNYAINGFAEANYVASLGGEMGRTLLGGMDTVPLLLAVPAFLAPIMALFLFRHNNKRNADDFYHSLPCTRQALFLSQLAAVTVWIIAILLVYTLTSLLAFLCLSVWYAINVTAILLLAFNCLAAALAVVGGIALAMSLTGTLFTNLVASVLILFGPRILLWFVSIFSAMPTVHREHLLGILDPPYNLVSNFLISMLQGEEPAVILFWQGGIYTLCLAVVYAALATWGFCRRHSECAGRSAGTSLIQTAFRVAFTMMICLIPCGIILTCVGENRWQDSYVFAIVITYVLALIAYFLYELITTKKLRNLLKSIPTLSLLLVLNAAVIFGVIGVKQTILHRDIAASEVSSVSFSFDESMDYSSHYSSNKNYFSKRESTVSYNDETIISLLADSFTENNKLLRQSTKKYSTATDSYRTFLVKFSMKNGGTLYRYVRVKPRDVQVLNEQRMKNEKLKEIYRQLPVLDNVGNTCSIEHLSAKHSREVYEVLRREVATIDFKTWYEFVGAQKSDMEADIPYETYDTVWLNYTLGAENSSVTFSLPMFLTETCNAYLERFNEENAADATKLAQTFRTYAEKFRDGKINYNDGMISYIDLTVCPMAANVQGVYTVSIFEEDEDRISYNTDAIADLLDSLSKKTARKAGPMYCVYLSVNDGEKYWDYLAYLEMPEGKVDSLFSSGEYILKQNAEK